MVPYDKTQFIFVVDPISSPIFSELQIPHSLLDGATTNTLQMIEHEGEYARQRFPLHLEIYGEGRRLSCTRKEFNL